MEGILPACQQHGKRKHTMDLPDTETENTASGSASTSQSGFGSPTIFRHKRQTLTQSSDVQQPQQAALPSFPVLDYHLQQCQQHQGTFLNNTLQPADSSTWSNWQQLPTFEQLQLLNQADQTMADSQPQLQRANSAPELVKLTQADSAAWQQAHAASTAGGANPPTSSALLSHRDYWVI